MNPSTHFTILLSYSLACMIFFSSAQNSANDPSNLLFLFDRVSEPIFIPKGDQRVAFKLPLNFFTDRYRPLADDLSQRFGVSGISAEIPVNNISVPDLSFANRLGRRDHFSTFVPFHRQIAARLISVFMGMKTYQDFLAAAVYARERVNPFLFVYALSVAMLHRPDTKNVPVPPLTEVFPEKYLDGSCFGQIREESSVVAEPNARRPVEIPLDYTATDLEPEHRVAYFREDLGVNNFHWHWHLVYPFSAERSIVDKDRRGELFFYLHQQIIARYNFERFSNRLGRTERLLNWRDPIPEAYFPKLDSLVASRVWPPRHANARLSDIRREQEQLYVDIQDLDRWRDRMFEAIHLGRVIDEQGKTVPLTEMGGIDVLGNIMEASVLSVNRNLYGDFHNMGHVILGLCHDPDGRHLETFSTVADPSTSMRDPVFYRFHCFVDDIFQEHKSTLPRYTVQQLSFDKVRVTGIQLQTQGAPANEFATFWQRSDIDMSRGLDFAPRGSVFVRFTHLQHLPFTYKVQYENGGQQRQGTVRIYLAPKFDESNVNMLYRDQRTLFIELDKFTVTLKPGKNEIVRRSDESSVTIPYERTFRDLERNRPTGGQNLSEFNYCGCGWPQHMLIPKGSAEGFPAELFVMISDYSRDKVDQPAQTGCSDAHSYCGMRDRKYPDARSMGYPFDRMPRDNVNTLRDFMTPNMNVIDVKIRFSNRVEDRQTATRAQPAPRPQTAQPQPAQPQPQPRPQPQPQRQAPSNNWRNWG